ncbi:MAG: hypothetical protein H0U88_09355 [Chthoniobacterales bacterium]|nr:hypothetical protein [Chthoniobacterales bacterium]MDQ3120429.1 hypothetical protein [Verrucomicrobiota bacterium]
MPDAAQLVKTPSRARVLIATVIVIVTILAVWKVIDYRTKPPPPPSPTGASAQSSSP